MDVPNWNEIHRRIRHQIAFVGPQRILLGSLSVCAVSIALWLLVRPSDPPIESSVPRASGADVSIVAPIATSAPSTVMVHVMGAVRRPGVFQLPSSARVIDAVSAAGGPIASADLERINLAQRIIDTEQVFVPSRQQRTSHITVAPRHRTTSTTSVVTVPGAVPPTIAGATTIPGPQTSTINLNSATATQLDTLPGVGPSTAKAIISFRTKNGGFKKVADLLNVPGIGQAKFEAIRELVSV